MTRRTITILGLLLSLSAAPDAPAATPVDKHESRGYTLPAEKHERAVAYSRARYRLYFLTAFWGVAVLSVLLFAGAAPALRNLVESLSSARAVQVLIFAPLLIALLDLLNLPLDAWGHWLAVRYDQSIQGWGSWAFDWTKRQLVGIVVATLLVAILYTVIRTSPGRWWFWFWLASQPILVFFLFLEPLVVAPLFYRFTPLAETQPALVREIGKVAAEGGLEIPAERMFEMKASAKLKSVNAYVAGLGASKRVVVWDTTIDKMTIPQTLFIFGHELGHYVLNHILKVIAFASAALFVLLFVAQRASEWAIARFGAVWQVRAIDDFASLPVLLLVGAIFGFFAAPLANAYSRSIEHEADVYGLEVIRSVVPEPRRTAADAFQVLGEIDLADPDPPPFIRFWLYSHPPLAERIRFAASYDPGAAPRFVK